MMMKQLRSHFHNLMRNKKQQQQQKANGVVGGGTLTVAPATSAEEDGCSNSLIPSAPVVLSDNFHALALYRTSESSGECEGEGEGEGECEGEAGRNAEGEGNPVDVAEEGSDSFQHLPAEVCESPGENHKMNREDWMILKQIGLGGFAKVYLVKRFNQPGDNALYAMKVVDKDHVIKKSRVHYLFSERNVLRTMEHPFIIKLHHTFQSETQLFFILSYLRGGDLGRYLHQPEHQRLAPAHAQLYAAEIYLALQFLHENGVIYRDLKPPNVLLDEQGHICLADMGLCKIFARGPVNGKPLEPVCSTNHTQTLESLSRCCDSMVGSPSYVAPDVLLKQTYGASVDWWSLGVLLFRMLTGGLPFTGKNTFEVFEAIVNQPPDFTPYPWVSSTAIDLIGGLLRKCHRHRLTGTAIKNHDYFSDVSWSDVLAKAHAPAGFEPSSACAPSTIPSEAITMKHGAEASPYALPTPLRGSQQELFRDFSYHGGNISSPVDLQPFQVSTPTKVALTCGAGSKTPTRTSVPVSVSILPSATSANCSSSASSASPPDTTDSSAISRLGSRASSEVMEGFSFPVSPASNPCPELTFAEMERTTRPPLFVKVPLPITTTTASTAEEASSFLVNSPMSPPINLHEFDKEYPVYQF